METTARVRALSEQVKSQAAAGVESVQRSMRGNPAMWAAVATGAGFAAGVAGRLLRHRLRRRSLPAVVVIEGIC